jgi:hypothetical protein
MGSYKSVVQHLLDAGVDPNRKTTKDSTSPWILALRQTHKLVRYRVKTWDTPTTEDFLGWTDILEQFLVHGADPNGYHQSYKAGSNPTSARSGVEEILHEWSSAIPKVMLRFERVELLLVEQGTKARDRTRYPRTPIPSQPPPPAPSSNSALSSPPASFITARSHQAGDLSSQNCDEKRLHPSPPKKTSSRSMRAILRTRWRKRNRS